MNYVTSSGYKQGPRLITYFVIALVGALIGGILVLTLAPGYIATRAGLLEPGADGGSPVGGATGAGDGLSPIEWTGDWPVTAVAELVAPCVVGVVSQTTYVDWFSGRQNVQESGGSGVIFRQAEGYAYVGTNQHVIEGSEKLYVVLAGGERREAELVGEDWWTDLAVVRVRLDGLSLPVAAFGDSDLLRPGELVVAIGNPVDLEFQCSVTVGVVSGLNRKVSYSDEREFSLIQTDAAINPGNSGGPLVNMAGQVVGISNMKIATQTVEGMGFAIPSAVAVPVFSDLVTYGRVIRPYLGVNILSAETARQRLGLNIDRGLYVVRVLSGGPAARAGIRQGDVITRIAGEAVSTLGDLRRILDRRRPGDEVSIELLRGGQTLTVTARLVEAPSGG